MGSGTAHVYLGPARHRPEHQIKSVESTTAEGNKKMLERDFSERWVFPPCHTQKQAVQYMRTKKDEGISNFEILPHIYQANQMAFLEQQLALLNTLRSNLHTTSQHVPKPMPICRCSVRVSGELHRNTADKHA